MSDEPRISELHRLMAHPTIKELAQELARRIGSGEVSLDEVTTDGVYPTLPFMLVTRIMFAVGGGWSWSFSNPAKAVVLLAKRSLEGT